MNIEKFGRLSISLALSFNLIFFHFLKCLRVALFPAPSLAQFAKKRIKYFHISNLNSTVSQNRVFIVSLVALRHNQTNSSNLHCILLLQLTYKQRSNSMKVNKLVRL